MQEYMAKYGRGDVDDAVSTIEAMFSMRLSAPGLALPRVITEALAYGAVKGLCTEHDDVMVVLADGYEQLRINGFIKE